MQWPLQRVVSYRVHVTLGRRSVRSKSGRRDTSMEQRQVPYTVVTDIGAAYNGEAP